MKPKVKRMDTKLSIILMVAATLGSFTEAHTNWISPAPRAAENIKVAPCGGVGPAAAVTATYTGGDMVTVTFHEFIAHVGFYGVGIATTSTPTKDADFTPLANPLPAPATNPYPNFMDPKIHIYNTKDKVNNMWVVTFKIPDAMKCSSFRNRRVRKGWVL